MKSGGSIVEAAHRHAVFAEGHKTHLAKEFNIFLLQIARIVRLRLGGKDLTDYSFARFDNLLSKVRDDMREVFAESYRHTRDQIIEFSHYEASFEARKLNQLLGVVFDVPARSQLRSAVLSAPLLQLTGPDKALLLRGFFQNRTERQMNIIEGAIKAGYYQGTPTTEIIKQIVGNPRMNYNDGLLAKAQREISTAVRTAAQHAAMVARDETYKENDDIITDWQFVATLDDRTSIECQSLDGQIFPLGEGPRPPIHPNCRSTTIPVLDKAFAGLQEGATRIAKGPDGTEIVPADMTYHEWLKTQPDDFQNVALGKTRAALLRSGKLTAERFSQLNLGRDFRPRTLDEMRGLDDKNMKRAFKLAENAR